jgi:hypothetical protein
MTNDNKSILTETDTLKQLVESAVTLSLISKKRSKIIKSYSEAYSQVNNVIASIPQKQKGFSSTKKSLKIVTNVLGGVLDGLESEDLTLKELRSISKQLDSVILPNFLLSVSSDTLAPEQKAIVETKPLSPIENQLITELNKTSKIVRKKLIHNKSFKESLEEVKEQLKGGASDKITSKSSALDDISSKELTKAYFSVLEKSRDSLPMDVSKWGFSIVRMPIIPIFNPTAKSGGSRAVGLKMDIQGQPNPYFILKAAGISAQSIDTSREYLVIEDQILLAISITSIPVIKVPKGKTKMVDKSLTPYEYAQLILSTINETSTSEYALVSDIFIKNPRRANIVLFWVMPSKTLAFLLRKGFPKLKEWGLPFKS